jgi:hypothetical protein
MQEYLMGVSALAWLLITVATDAEPDPREEEDLWRDYGGEAGGA